MKKILFWVVAMLIAMPVMAQYDGDEPMDGGGPSMSFPVKFKGAKPGISDFVTAILSQEDLGEMLGNVSGNWDEYRKGRKLDKGAKFTVDERNGYIRFDEAYTSGESSYTEFCYWNCADGKHKVVATNCGCVMNGKPIETEYTGLQFYTYENATRKLTYASTYDMGASVEVTPVVTYALPRIGKDIMADIHAKSGKVKIRMKWNGQKFDQEQVKK